MKFQSSKFVAKYACKEAGKLGGKVLYEGGKRKREGGGGRRKRKGGRKNEKGEEEEKEGNLKKICLKIMM